MVVAAATRRAGPFLTVEPVLTEACFLLQRVNLGVQTLLGMVRDGHLRVGLALEAEVRPIEALMKRYVSVPMSLADACLVRLAELRFGAQLFTLDSDFHIYRKHRNRRIELVDLG